MPNNTNTENTVAPLPETKNLVSTITKELPLVTATGMFIYLCGGLFLVCYWENLDIHIAGIVTITEIPKAFIFPFLLVNGYTVFRALLLTCEICRRNKLSPEKYKGKELESQHKKIIIWIFLIVLTIVIYVINHQSWLPPYLFSLVLSYHFCELILNVPSVKKGIPNIYLRRYIIVVFITTPIISMVMGYYESYKINHNFTGIKYINIKTKDSTFNFTGKSGETLKLLGFVGDKIIISTRDNQRKYILNQSSAGEIELITEK